MRNRTLAVLASLGLAIGALAVPAAANGAPPPSPPPVSVTHLAGADEVPGPGDPDGSGVAIVRWNTDDGTICYKILVRQIEPATAAHIHVGAEDVAGPVVQGLTAPTDGHSSGCVVNAPLADALAADPGNYYVNVHNAEYPAGAVRGQLD
jgi:CHRD domain